MFNNSSKHRSYEIARTEVSRATNYSTVEAYQQSGVVTGKKWLTGFDERTCVRCKAMHGKIVAIDKNFFNKGDTFQDLNFNYDAVGQPPLHVSCRCTTTAVILK